jgi:hypothetical protein
MIVRVARFEPYPKTNPTFMLVGFEVNNQYIDTTTPLKSYADDEYYIQESISKLKPQIEMMMKSSNSMLGKEIEIK